MRYGSVCSGIEAATMAWHALGWEPAFFSEIEAFPRAVLEHHYPAVPLHGDFTTIEENQYGKIDLLVGGTPCQSFSVAGLRGGLDDERGNLALEFCRLAQRERPRWIVWENVPGVLSSNGGRDFGSILGALAELGYGLAYRVLDAQYFGVAQRRRRVFVVGYLGDWRRAAAVLFERHSLSGHPAPRREARKDAASGPASGADSGGGIGSYSTGGAGLAVNISNGEPRLADVTGTLDCWSMKGRGSSQQQAVLTDRMFVPDVVAFDTTQVTSPHNYSNPKSGDPVHPLAAGAHPPAIAIQERAICENPNAGPDGIGVRTDDAAYTLEARTVPQAVAFSPIADCLTAAYGTNWNGNASASNGSLFAAQPVAFSSNMSVPDCQTDGTTPTLKLGDHGGGNPPAVAFDLRGRDGGSQLEGPHDTANIRAASGGSSRSYVAAFPIDTMNHIGRGNGHSLGDFVEGAPSFTLTKGHSHAVAFQSSQSGVRLVGTHATLDANNGSRRHNGALVGSAVRRLTPVECERLQGFPDNFTAIPWKKKGAEDCPDGPRYKALGNSMAVPVMRWIGERIQMIEDLTDVL